MTNYAEIAEVKAQVGKTATDADPVLTAMVAAASRAIDNFCNRPDGFVAVSTATARVYTGTGKTWLRIDECAAITTVSVKESVSDTSYTDWVGTDWIAFRGDPERPNFNRTPYDAVMVLASGNYAAFLSGGLDSIANPTVQITAKWGYATTVPDAIKQAAITLCARWWKRGESAWSDVLASGELGQLLYRKELDPDVKMMLVAGRYVRRAIG